MGIFDDVVVNAKAAANVVGKKAGTFVDVSKLKFTASGLSNDIHKKYKLLGQEVYNQYKNGTIDSYDFSEISSEIDDLTSQLEVTNQLIMAAKDKVICDVCGAELSKDNVYCSQCGAKLDENKKEETPQEPKETETVESTEEETPEASE